MALLFFDGFDHWESGLGAANQLTVAPSYSGYSTNISPWIANPNVGLMNNNAVPGLLGGKTLQSNSMNLRRFGADQTTLGMGMRWRLGNNTISAGITDIFQFLDHNGAAQCGFAVNTSGRLFVYRGTTATVLQVGAVTTILPNAWYMFAFKVKFDNTVGTWELRVAGVNAPPELSGTGDTVNTAVVSANGFSWLPASNQGNAIDDVYGFDDTGPAPYNDFLPVHRIETLFATIPAATPQWTPLTQPTPFRGFSVSTGTARANTIQLTPFTTLAASGPVGGDVISVVIKLGGNMTGNIKCAIYDAANPGNQPKNLLATSSTTLTNPLGSTTLALAPDLTFAFSGLTLQPNTPYWLAFLCDNATATHWHDSSTAGVRYATTYPTFVNPLVPATIVTGENPFSWNMNWTGANVIMVNEVDLNNDTSYNFTPTVGAIDMFNHQPLSSNPTNIFAVSVDVVGRKDDVTVENIRSKLKVGTTTVNGSTNNQNTVYATGRDVYLTSPDTGLPWTGPEVDASQIGYEHP